MADFLRFFDEKIKVYPMHLEIYYSKIMNWVIGIWKGNEGMSKIVEVQDIDIELCFAKAHVALKEWLTENEGGY